MNEIISTSRFVRFLPILTVILVLAIALLPPILGITKNSIESQRQWESSSSSKPEEVLADWGGTGAADNIPIDELTILGTVDGFLHGVDRASNRLLWSTSTGKPMLGTTVAESEKTVLQSDDRDVETIIPTIDGNVMIHGGRHLGSHNREENDRDTNRGDSEEDDNVFIGSNTMRKTSVTARVLTENAPFISQDGVLFTGQKTTSLFGLDLDLHTGDLLSSVGSGSSSISSDSGSSLNHARNSQDSTDKRNAVIATRSSELAATTSKTNMLWLGRIDYGLRATNMHSGQRHFDLTYAEWQPLSSSLLPEITDGKGAIQNSDFSIVSTPQGELFFADPDSGELLTKHASPLNLKSPVISAFSVKKGKRDRSGYHSMKDGTFSVSNLKVRHRFAPLPATDLLSESSNSVATVGGGGDEEEEEREVAKIDAPSVIAENIEPGSVLIVQSSQGIHSDGMLYAIEVPITPIVSTTDSVLEQQPYLLLSSDDSRQWGLEKNDGMKKTEAGSMSLHSDRSLLEMDSPLDISAGRIADVLGTATTIKPPSSGVSPPSLQAVKSSIAARQQQKKNKLLSQRLTMNSVAEEQNMELARVLTDYTVQSDDDIMAELESTDYFDDFYANEDDDYVSGHSLTRPPPLRPQELLEDVLLLPDSAPSSPILRQGRYRIHSDPYNGGMLTPSQQLLMENILLTKNLNQLRSEIDSRLPQADDEYNSDGGEFPPTSALFRLFFNKKAFLKNIVQATQVLQVFFLSLMLLVVSLLIILLFGVAVANLSVPYAVVLTKYPFLQQLLVLAGRPLIVILHFLQLDFLAVGAVRSLLSSDGLSSPTASPSRMTTKSRSDSATLSVDYDESGRKVTKVGSLAIYETVLGYGSHGTVVFKGSLNGRPVAIKRMLSQFNKAANREISLLIKSDGHPNVVRYFLKEQKSDFVYLALQLCEMSLKDFIVKVRCNKPVPNNGSEDDTKPEQVTDDVRSSLLQIAQGIAHLHAQRIVHRDIKPHNILCANPNENPYGNNSAPSSSSSSDESKGISTAATSGSSADNGDRPCEEPVSLRHLQRYILKISDMGLSKQLDKDENSFSSYSYVSMSLNSSVANNGAVAAALNSPVGTIGWQAPELMAKRYTSNSPPSPTSSINSSSDSFIEEAGLALLEDELARELEDEDIDRVDIITDDVSLSILSDDGQPLPSGETNTVSVYKRSKKERQRKISELYALRQKRKKTQTVDIFSLGCVFFYVLTLGEHPYGQWFEREVNIMTSKVDLSLLSTMGLQDAVNLVSKMLQADPLDRPTAAEVCLHHFFWSAAKRLEFLVEFSDRLEQEPPTSVLVMAVESNAMTIIGSNCSGKWDRKLDATLLEDMGKYRKYDTSSVRDLLRVIRNKRHHYHELSPSVKAMVGALPVGFCSYFEARFPLLLSHCVDIAKKYLHSDRLFSMLFYRDTLLRPVEANSTDSSKKFSSGSSIVSPNPSSKGSDVAVGDSHQLSLAVDSLASHDDVDGEKSNYNHHSSQSSDSGNTTSSSSTATATVCVDGVVVWHGSVLQQSLKSKGWWRDSEDWAAGSVSAAGGGVIASGSKKNRPSHLVKAAADLKYRTRLCTHWETTGGSTCPMRKKGKCIFAHGPIELRVKETRRDRWGLCSSTATPSSSSTTSATSSASTPASSATVAASPADTVLLMRFSGGEDVLGAARQIEKVRHHEGSISEFEKQSSPPPHSHMNHSSNSHHARPHMGPGVPHHPMYYHPQNMSTFYAQNNFGR